MDNNKKKNNRMMIHGVILASASILVRLIGLFYRIPVTNIIGDVGNGFYSYAFEIYNIALLLSSYSLPTAVSKIISTRVHKKDHKNAYKIFKATLFFAASVGTITSLIIFFGADFIAGTIMQSELSAYALKVLAPCLLIVALLGVFRGYCQGLGTMIPTAVSQVLEQIMNAVVSIVAASYLFTMGTTLGEKNDEPLLAPAYGAAGGTLGTVMGALVALLFMVFIFFSYKKVSERKRRRAVAFDEESYSDIYKVLLLTIVPIIFSTAVYNISTIVAQIMYNNIMDTQGNPVETYSSLWGIFSGKAKTLINVPLGVADAFAMSFIPSITKAVVNRNRKEVHQKIGIALRIGYLVAIPSFVGFAVFATPILNLLYNDNSNTASLIFLLSSISILFYCGATITNSILQVLNHMNVPIKNALISLVGYIAILFILLTAFKMGIYAVVVGNILFGAFMSVLNLRAIQKLAHYRQEYKKTFVLPFISAIIMGAVSYGIYFLTSLIIPDKIATVVGIIVAVITYVIALIKTGTTTEKELQDFPKGDKLVTLFKKLHILKK